MPLFPVYPEGNFKKVPVCFSRTVRLPINFSIKGRVKSKDINVILIFLFTGYFFGHDR